MLILCELTSGAIVSKSRSSGKFSRYENSRKVNRMAVTRVGLLEIKEGSSDLNVYLYVNSASDVTKKYRVDLQFVGFIQKLKDFADQHPGNDARATVQTLVQNLRSIFMQELQRVEVKVNCECPDFLYRIKDSARNGHFYFGIDSDDDRLPPNQNTLNPHYEGSACKHIIKALTTPSLWLNQVIKSLSDALLADNNLLATLGSNS